MVRVTGKGPPRQQGFGLFDAMLAAIVMVVGVVVALQIHHRRSQQQALEQAVAQMALRARQHHEAVGAYVRNNEAGWPNDSRVVVSTTTLISGGYLPGAYSDITPLHTRFEGVAYKDAGGVTRYLTREVGAISEATLQRFGIEPTPESLQALKIRVARAYTQENLLGAYTTSAALQTAVSASGDFSKNLGVHFLIPAPVQPVALVLNEDFLLY